ncbi:MAG: 2-phospho-L-lactate transferase [Gammaproteobacteria bacterium]|nr:2-phospho-L-lactate transferase [Gammaproteobacteria bacterium]|tara:strand:+ start:586 stop:1518 length:933 start_codon:yes stop_codon:yes gene_type:complete
MPRILAITGGVGGAKLALGLSRLLGPDEVAFAVNTGDDFEHLGLEICPDLDTLIYTLSGLANPDTGWGRRDETWGFLDTLDTLGGEAWFRLGDHDLALHVRRTEMLRDGATRTAAAAEIAGRLGIAHRLLPMSDDPVRTLVHTAGGPLAFQHYFVRDRCEPAVTGFEFRGADRARPNPAIVDWLEGADGVVICPSNPFVSVDPMLSIPGLRQALMDSPAPVVAVSPIVGGAALKGPAAKMMAELELPARADQVARHYGELLDGFVMDQQDADLAGGVAVETLVTQTVMRTLEDRVALAEAVLAFCDRLKR